MMFQLSHYIRYRLKNNRKVVILEWIIMLSLTQHLTDGVLLLKLNWKKITLRIWWFTVHSEVRIDSNTGIRISRIKKEKIRREPARRKQSNKILQIPLLSTLSS